MTDDQRDEYNHVRREKPVRIRARKVQPKEKAILLGMMAGLKLTRHDHFPGEATYTMGKDGEGETVRRKVDTGLVALMVQKGLLWAPGNALRGDVEYTRTELAQDATVHNWTIRPSVILPDLFLKNG